MTYRPGKGIETYLRENWSLITARQVAQTAGQRQEPTNDLVSAWAKLDPASAIEAAMISPLVWFTAFARIVDKENRITGENEFIRPFAPQVRAFEAYQWLVAGEHPVRLILGPKPRQSGISSAACAICAVHSLRNKVGGMVIGDEADRTDLLWRMFNQMIQKDRIRADWKVDHEFNSERATFSYNEGRERHSFAWGHDTANDPNAGSSGTRQIIWFSEVGLYSKEGAVTDTTVISNANNSVPLSAGTVIIMESVAGGSMGAFFDYVQGAVTLEQRKAGRYGNGWVKVFCAWWEIPDYRLLRNAGNGELFDLTLSDREQRGVALYKWTPEQIAWRRQKVNELKGNEKRFDSEFPESESVAFQSSGSPRFNNAGVTRMETQALLGHRLGQLGGLTENKLGSLAGIVQFIPGNPEWLWLREKPMFGAKYLVFGDYMTGKQSEGSEERDAHAVGVWRAPYITPAGQPHGAKLVAAIIVPDGVRWEDSIIAERTHLLSRFFGGAIITMEVNEALGILAHLEMMGANLWKRSKDDKTVPGQTLRIPGWRTTQQTKRILVGAMADWINDPHSQCEFEPMVSQARTFITWPDGHDAASRGAHDDWILGGGIGLALIDCATEFTPPAPRLPVGYLEREQGGMPSKGAAAFS